MSTSAGGGRPQSEAQVGVSESDKSGAELSDVEHAMLAFEQKWWKYAGAKETAVREEFDMSMTRYYQVLNALIDRPAALVADPLTVGRLRRLRAARQAGRSARLLGSEPWSG